MRFAIVMTLTLTALGCGQSQSTEPPINWGVIDASLPPEQQQRQEALIRLFKTLQAGNAIEHIKSYEPDLEFQESSAEFFGEGIHLTKWNWAGPPEKDKLRVQLVFILDEAPGDKIVAYERTYQVTRAGNRFVIRRAG